MTLALNVGPTAFVGPNRACANHSCFTKKNKPTTEEYRIPRYTYRAMRTYSPFRSWDVSDPSPRSSASTSRPGKSSRPNTTKYVPYAYAPSALPPQFEEKTNSAALVKQAYSAWVTDPKTNQRCKYHLTAYFTFDDLPHIPTVESQSELRDIVIPQGVYRSGKSRTSARNLVQSAEPARTSMPFRAIAKIPSTSASPDSSPTSAHSGHLSPWTSPGSSSSNLHTFHPESTYAYTPYSTSPAVTPRGSSENDLPRDRGHCDYAPPPPLHSRASHSTTTSCRPSRLPSVASLFHDTDSGRLDRTPEDHRVIQMLNSRHIM